MDVPNAGAMVANISKLIPRSDDEDGADRAFDEDNMVLQVVPVVLARRLVLSAGSEVPSTMDTG